jgi:hypothetical protein
LKLSRPVALSRNQDVDLALLSYLDLTVAAVGLLVFASGTFIAGWRRRKRRLAQRHRDSPADRVPPDLIEALADEPRSEEPAVDGPAVQWSRAERRPVPAAADRPEPGPLREPVARSSPHPAPATAWRQRIVHTRLVVVARREHARMIEAVRRRPDRIRAEGTMGSGPLGYLDELRSAASRLGADTRRGEDRPDPAGELVGVARSLGTDTSDSATPGDGAQ